MPSGNKIAGQIMCHKATTRWSAGGQIRRVDNAVPACHSKHVECAAQASGSLGQSNWVRSGGP